MCRQMMEARMAECTFMPQINPSPNEPTDASISRFDQLFFDSESRRRRQRQYADWYPEGLVGHPDPWISLLLSVSWLAS